MDRGGIEVQADAGRRVLEERAATTVKRAEGRREDALHRHLDAIGRSARNVDRGDDRRGRSRGRDGRRR